MSRNNTASAPPCPRLVMMCNTRGMMSSGSVADGLVRKGYPMVPQRAGETLTQADNAFESDAGSSELHVEHTHGNVGFSRLTDHSAYRTTDDLPDEIDDLSQ